MLMTLVLLTLQVPPVQLPPNTQLSVSIPENTPFKIEFTYDTTPLPFFRWWCNGEIKKNFTSGEIAAGQAGTTFQVTVPGMLKGVYSCLVSAFTPETEVKSDSIQVPIGYVAVPVTKPYNLKVVVGGSTK